MTDSKTITLTSDWKEILPGVEMRITAPVFYLAGVEAEIRFTSADAVRRYPSDPHHPVGYSDEMPG